MQCKICTTEFSEFYLGKHVKHSHGILPEQYYTDYLNNPVGKCKQCSAPTKFKSMAKGFRDFCSPACLTQHIKSNNQFKKEIQAKSKKATIEKYGVDNVFETDWCKKKIRHTMTDKYGGIGHASGNIRKKIELTNLKKYGSTNVFSNEDIIKKCVKNKDYKSSVKKTRVTNLEKYGVDCIFKLKAIKTNALDLLHASTVNNIFNGNRLDGKVRPLFSPTDYDGVKTAYNWKCESCNTEFNDNLDDGKIPRCPVCLPYKYSKEEIEILNYIKSVAGNDIILVNDRTILNGLELDIYIPSKNLAFEINGTYWHTEISGGKNKNYHVNKTELCEEKGIQLIHILDTEWKQSQEIVCNKIKTLFGKNTSSKIYARKCKIQTVSPKIAGAFLIKHHIQGRDKSSVKLGLFNNNELVALMTFGNLRIALGSTKTKNVYELYRYCTGIPVIGGASKLLSHFIKMYHPDKIITYADRRYSTGNLYGKLNFNLIGKTPPNYWYTKDYIKKYHRFNYRKQELAKKLPKYDSNLTEWENMKANGYDRIWDCGSLKYELTVVPHAM